MLNLLVVLLLLVFHYGQYVQAADLDLHYKFAAVSTPTKLLENTWGSYQTDLFSGSFGYGFPIKVPPGTKGLQPELQLSYNSHSARGKSGWVGLGWDLPIPFIQRDIEYTRKDQNDDSFDLYLGGKHDLVYVSADGRYRTSIDTFFKIEAFNSDGNPAGNAKNPAWWIVRMKDGTQYRFGRNSDARKIIQSSDTSFAPYGWRWHLDTITDSNGNTITYQYQQVHDGSDIGAVYLSRITYNSENLRTIDFIRENNPCAYQTINQGSEEKLAQRLKQIDIKVSGALVRQYKLGYAQNSLGTNSLLTSVQEIGSDGVTALPATTFSYQAFTPGFDAPQPWGWSWNTPIRETKTDGVDTVKDVLDVNGDGLPDRGYENNGWKIRLNTGNGFSASESEWSWNISQAFRDIHDPDSASDSADTKGAPMDMNRDGYLDYVHAEDVNTGGIIQINFGGATSFGGVTSWASPPTDSVWVREVRSVDANEPNVKGQLMDINGDGYPDFVKRLDDTTMGSWLGTGSGFGQYLAWVNPIPGTSGYLYDYDKDDGAEAAHETQIGFYDMNGDGLDDIVDARNSDWQVYFNTGSNFIYAGSWAGGEQYTNDLQHDGDERHDLFDINGDGLPDKVLGQQTNYLLVRFNTGRGFTSEQQWPTGRSMPDNLIRDVKDDGTEVARDFIDLNGDGLVDMVFKTSGDWEVSRNLAQKTDLMTGVRTSFGGTVAAAYSSSRIFTNTRLPFNYWLVSSVTTDNGMGGDHAVRATIGYSYEGGLYDFSAREFHGFSKVTESLADNTKVEHHFHQDAGAKGKQKFQPIYAADGSKLATNEDIWDVATPAAGVYSVLLTASEQKDWDGTGRSRALRTEFANYDPYGNARLIRHSVSTYFFPKTLFEYTEYSYNTSAWIVDKPSRKYFASSEGGTALRDIRFSYDGKAFAAAPDKGNLSQQIQEIDTGDDAITGYTHDLYGNQISITNPEGRVSHVEYDTTYHTFPIRSFNAKNQLTQRSFAAATGNPLSETDPNGYVILYAYDALHRQIGKALPYDSLALPTEGRSFSINGIAPEHVKLSKRESSGTNAVLVSYQIVDGFGNLIQSKSESNASTNQIAVNYFYNKLGRVEKQSNPLQVSWSDGYTAASKAAFGTTYTYDGLGRPILVTNPDGTFKSREFGLWSVTETDENSHKKVYAFNARKQPDIIVEEEGAESFYTLYGYNLFGDLTSVKDHLGNTTLYTYDSLGRKTTVSDADLGDWTYNYDRSGNLIQQTDGRNNQILATYDELNRKTKDDYPHDDDVIYSFDTPIIGTVSKIVDNAGEVTFQYDQRLRKISEKRTFDSNSWLTEWGYDALDRLVSEKRPDGEIVEYQYDSQGLLDKIPGIISNLDYNVSGQMISKAYANGLTSSYSYDPQNFRLTALNATGLQQYSYLYDNIGNITSISNGINTSSSETYGYDGLDRLTRASGPGYVIDYSLDAIGNIRKVTKNGKVENYYYGKNNRLPHAPTTITSEIPVVEKLTVNQGALWTISRTVTLESLVNGPVTEFMLGEDPNFAGGQWQTYQKSISYQIFNPVYGEKILYFKVRNTTVESEFRHVRISYLADTNNDKLPDVLDQDNDGMLDSWELLNGLNQSNPNDADADIDGDGLSNKNEFTAGTNPRLMDSDGDQLTDQEEIDNGSNPISSDTDGDGLDDGIDPNPITSLHKSFSENFSHDLSHLVSGGSMRTYSTGLNVDNIGNGLTHLYYTLSGDISGDNKLDLMDVILGLQVVSGSNPAGITTIGDVNKDQKIGIEEVQYILRNIQSE